MSCVDSTCVQGIGTGETGCSAPGAFCTDSEASCIGDTCILQIGEGPCAVDSDCEGAITCSPGGVCGGDGAVCADNAECVEACVGGVCGPYSLIGESCDANDDSDCAGALTCEAGVCEQSIGTGETGCSASNTYCSDANASCVGDTCVLQQGEGTCTSDAECEGALTCEAGVCEAGVANGGTGCTTDAYCTDANASCVSDTCVLQQGEGTCTSDAECEGALKCDAGVCKVGVDNGGAGCSAPNSYCVDTNASCVSDTCLLQIGEGTCTADGECEGAVKCSPSGICGGDGAVCADNAECAEACIGGICGPTSSIGESCDAGDDTDCAGTLTCEAGVCEQGVGTGETGCGASNTYCEDASTVCVSDTCVFPVGQGPCTANAECEGAVACSPGGTCGGDGAVCADNAECAEACIGGTCGPTSEIGGACDDGDDTDCSEGLCAGSTCEVCKDDATQPNADTGCGGATPFCNADHGVGGNICVACIDSNDCSVGLTCNAAGSCVTGCANDGECDPAHPICDLSGGAPGVCETCVNDATGTQQDMGCGSDAPICVLNPTTEPAINDGGAACKVCVDDKNGTDVDTGCGADAPICDALGTGLCVGCVDDSLCPGVTTCSDEMVCVFPDTDGDGAADNVDIDDDGDGIPDSVEGNGTDYSLDADNDGIPNAWDPDFVNCNDVDADGVCDALPREVDADGDGIPNHIDLDSDGDGVPDAVEGQDADGDGLPDRVAIGNDRDADGLDDAFDLDCAGVPSGCMADGVAAPVRDTDEDGAPDFLDGDSDGDDLPDAIEAFDGDGDGRPEAVASGIDENQDGLDDAFDVNLGGMSPTGQDIDGDFAPDYLDADSDGDGIMDSVECAIPNDCADTDNDGAPNYLDVDSDGDGVPDNIEAHDVNHDGVADVLPLGMDDDDDGVDDAYDPDMAGSVVAPLPDTDDDGTPDYLDTDDDGDNASTRVECPDGPICPDEDNDGRPDYLDTDSTPPDADGDGIPDDVECDGDVANCKDSDGDGTPDYLDPDDDDDGTPTSVECASDPLDCDDDDDGVPNYLDLDSDNDGIMDSVECSQGNPCEDTDRDGTPDFLDTDSDGDGILDIVEGHDANSDGVPDTVPLHLDDNQNGLDDAFDPDAGGTLAPLQDTDSNTVPDFRDPDDDGDGIATIFECTNPNACEDRDFSNIPDYLEFNVFLPDTDGDGIPDYIECPAPGDTAIPETCPDTDMDGFPNFNDPDDDGDGIPTANEDLNGNLNPTDDDTDGDGFPITSITTTTGMDCLPSTNAPIQTHVLIPMVTVCQTTLTYAAMACVRSSTWDRIGKSATTVTRSTATVVARVAASKRIPRRSMAIPMAMASLIQWNVLLQEILRCRIRVATPTAMAFPISWIPTTITTVFQRCKSATTPPTWVVTMSTAMEFQTGSIPIVMGMEFSMQTNRTTLTAMAFPTICRQQIRSRRDRVWPEVDWVAVFNPLRRINRSTETRSGCSYRCLAWCCHAGVAADRQN
ncbi:MAG: hypothetical protein R3A47_05680 [Polyangiales bacterium]